MNQLVTKKLKIEGYRVDSCYDGKEALAYIEMAEYGVIVLDFMLPD